MKRVVILGAAGRDFHDFNTLFRNNPEYQVVAFTATQIPDIAGRRYPAELAGPLYPDGIPIVEEKELESLIADRAIDIVVFSYSDIAHANLMHLASRALAAGADFWLPGGRHTELKANVPVISICAVRTGCGKSPVARRVLAELRNLGWNPVVVRHPMPYGDLARQAVQRFATLDDLQRHECTIEECEEYEPHIVQRHRGVRRRGLRGHPAPRREGSRPHPLGRRQQRHAFLPLRPGDRGRRPASRRPRNELLPGRGQPPPRPGRHHQQGEHRARAGGGNRPPEHQPGQSQRHA